MSRWEFMRRLEELLSDISPSEREEALQYYNDYINDAGRENEAEAIRSLGSPEQVAKSIKEGLGLGETTNTGYTECAYESDTYSSDTYSGDTYTSGTNTQQGVENDSPKKDKLPVWAIVLIVIGCILLSPAILGLLGGILGGITGIIGAIFGIIVGVGATAIALVIAGIALIIAGFGTIIVHPLVFVGLLGAGLICIALGILLTMLEVFLCGICIPEGVKGIIYLYKKYVKKEVA